MKLFLGKEGLCLFVAILINVGNLAKQRDKHSKQLPSGIAPSVIAVGF